ncbi:hypothetical protein N9N43_02925 [Alphaproteobacteria bacterium]|nr:hypothetical protein [Alphaproteobacteria bacterium]MDA8780240.1 hypothetical protein [Alphaproteobacteria bacterium]
MKKKIRDAEVALAFSVDAHFVGPATGLNIGGRNGVRFQLWFSEQTQKACSSLDGMNYHIKTDIEGIRKEADLGDGLPRGNSYQTIKEFDILHHGDLTQNPVHLWAKFKSFGF